ncbi:MAG: hypothetical protein L0Z62_39840 [Gemmataceae bacterium]|nr:hypothetical protein [Gemmataceae bacterium]
MKLSPEEELFLRHWMHDEWHFREGRGAAKQLQVESGVVPADLAALITAAFPDPAEQLALAENPPRAASLAWPWTEQTWKVRLAEARAVLAVRESGPPSPEPIAPAPPVNRGG